MIGSLVLTAVLIIVFAYGLYDTTTWSERSRLFAQAFLVPALALSLLQFVLEIRGLRSGRTAVIEEEGRFTRRALAWFLAFFVSIWAVGAIALPLFTLAYLRVAGGQRWIVAIPYSAILAGFVGIVFVLILRVPLPTGLF